MLAALAGLAGCSTTGNATRMTLLPETTRQAPASRAIEGSLLAPLDGGLVSQSGIAGLSERDRVRALQAEYRALEHAASGEAVAWKAGSGSLSGSVTAAQPYRVGTQDCRQYTHIITDGAAPHEVKGAACRNADGSWSRLT
ncbi:MAG: hypothetical protein KDH93_06925 [Rhodoferax sp.]|nr:hypothetical protein [Rhodoferax sp.]